MNILLTHNPSTAADELVSLRSLLASTQMRVLTVQMLSSASPLGQLTQEVVAGPEQPVYINAGPMVIGVTEPFVKKLTHEKTLVLFVDSRVDEQSLIVKEALEQGQSCLTLHRDNSEGASPWLMNLATEISALILHSPPPTPCELVVTFEKSIDSSRVNHISQKESMPNFFVRTRSNTDEALSSWLEGLVINVSERLTSHSADCSCCTPHFLKNSHSSSFVEGNYI